MIIETLEGIAMDSMGEILNQTISRKMTYSNIPKCELCGEDLGKLVNICDKEFIGKRMCRCEREKYAKDKADQEAREKQIRLNQIMNNSLMDAKFRGCTFNNWDFDIGDEKIYKYCKKYADEFGTMKKEGIGMMLIGEPGNGKTFAVSCIANQLMERLVPCVCVSIDSLLSKIKSTYSKHRDDMDESEVIRSLTNADLLIIDDLGTEQDGPWSRTTIYNIIDHRYRTGLPMIITTNVSMEELKQRYHSRVIDRINEMCTAVRNESKSIRKDKAKDKNKIFRDLVGGN
jgi:DNA replication protein DnaC